MDEKEIMGYVDHTLLSPVCTWDEIETLCNEAVKYQAASVCIPPAYVSRVREKYNKLNITTVIGFPLGYQTKEVKVYEALDSIKNGANEIDMVINITDVKNKNYKKIEDEIREIKEAIGENILKVIVETCYLSEEEKIEVSKLVSKAKADYIKTSTGFGTSGATIEDVKILKDNIDDGIKIKAAGGIRSKEDMIQYINLGCSRLGTSSAVKILYDKD